MNPTAFDRSSIVPLAFATAVSMWAVAYLFRLPAVMAPSWLLLAAMLGVIAVWGWIIGRRAAGGWRAGAAVGAAAAVINLLILGSLLSSADDGALLPSAVLWVPGSLLVSALVAAAFAAAAGARADAYGGPEAWTALFAKVAVAATFLLVVAGGLVTSHEAGLAVVDWPNTFGTNMFLYPLARMTG
ncbi:MAG TPA: hypothetical protein VLT81_14275, partial [Chondromyces sp.]|nr:hypothetical protein [Chondromyces sp.]